MTRNWFISLNVLEIIFQYINKRSNLSTCNYLTTKIIPLSDVLVDIHSGGKTMMFSPFATYQNVPNIGVNQKAKEAALSFAAPICLEIVELDPD